MREDFALVPVDADRLLLLPPGGGAPVQLATAPGMGQRALGYSQQVMQVSPDGRLLAWAEPRGTGAALHLRSATEDRIVAEGLLSDFRFSPDGRELALLVGDSLRVVDLSTFAVRVTDGLAAPRWLEHTAQGLLVLHTDAAGVDTISLVRPWRGATRVAVSPAGISRMTASSASGRVVWFEPAPGGTSRIWSLDFADPTAEPTRAGTAAGGVVRNAEMAPDGSSFAFVTGWGLFVADGGPVPRPEDAATDVHSLWYGPGSELAWASPNGLSLLDAAGRHTLAAPEGDVRTARFRRDGAGLVFVRGATASAWDPATGRVTSLGAAAANQALVATDSFAGGVVLWTHGAGVNRQGLGVSPQRPIL